MSGSEISREERLFERVKFYTSLVSSIFKFSLSGAHEPTARTLDHGGLPPYEMCDRAIIDQLNAYSKSYDYIASFNLALSTKTGDCSDQALLLAATLKNIPEINNHYCIFSTRCADCHTFLTLIPRTEKLNCLSRMFQIQNATLYDKNKGILIADPWRNRVYRTIDDTHHPLDYDPDLIFRSSKIELQNLDFCYLSMCQKFGDFLKDPFSEAIPTALKQYCLVLKLSSVYSKWDQPYGPYADCYVSPPSTAESEEKTTLIMWQFFAERFSTELPTLDA